MDFNKEFLTVTTVTTTDSQEPASVTIPTCRLLNEVGVKIPLPYKVSFRGAKFDRGLDQLMCGSLMHWPFQRS